MITISPTHRAGSVTAVPGLPSGFTDVFTSLIVDTGSVRLHAVVGGRGPALLLLPGWPQTWYAWRKLMPALAEDHTVVAADPRGTGLSDAPRDGYDSATLAQDLAEAMTLLGHPVFTAIGYDQGMLLAYALASDHPDRVDRLIIGEATRGFAPSPPMSAPQPVAEKAWHFAFNRAGEISERMVLGREEIYFTHQFRSKASSPTAVPDEAIGVYVDALKASPATLRASFEYYRDDATDDQQRQRRRTPLSLPVLAISGEASLGEAMGPMVAPLADDLTTIVLPDTGHFLPDEAPDALLDAIRSFLPSTPGE